MARYDHLPIWKTVLELAVATERAVAHFPRSHKYALGTDLRRTAQQCCALVVRANACDGGGSARSNALEDLVATVESFKTLTALGKELRAFHNFNEFAHLAELSVALGKQSGGWRRQCLGQRQSLNPHHVFDAARA